MTENGGCGKRFGVGIFLLNSPHRHPREGSTFQLPCSMSVEDLVSSARDRSHFGGTGELAGIGGRAIAGNPTLRVDGRPRPVVPPAFWERLDLENAVIQVAKKPRLESHTFAAGGCPLLGAKGYEADISRQELKGSIYE
jgi:hypothetical protein